MSTYNHDYAAFDRLVLAAPFMVEEMARRAEAVKLRAETTAPYDPDSEDGTHYRDAFTVTSGVRELPTRRAYGRVSNDDGAAVFIEFGSIHNPRYRTLGNALDAAAGGAIHGRTFRSIFKGTKFEPPKPKPRKPRKPKGTTP